MSRRQGKTGTLVTVERKVLAVSMVGMVLRALVGSVVLSARKVREVREGLLARKDPVVSGASPD